MIFFLFILMSVVALTLPLEARRISAKTISEFVQEYPQTKWIKCTQNYAFNYPSFPLYREYFPDKGYHSDISIIEVSGGVACIDYGGHVFVNDVFFKETGIKHHSDPFYDKQYIFRDELKDVLKISGRIAIVNHIAPYVYGHWIFDILGQLALLEINNIEYDYLWIPYEARFTKETLDIWGIDRAKIIPLYLNAVIQADTIILPTYIGHQDLLIHPKAFYYPDFLLKYVHDKMLSGINLVAESDQVSEKIFISRKGASRAALNEDDIFALFEPLGFKRYELGSLSVAQQIALFHNAKTIVSFLGSNSTNVIFSRPEAHFVEIFQSMIDATFFYVSQVFGLKHSCINGTTSDDLLWSGPGTLGRQFPLHLVENFITDHYFEL